jgi:hypothetical protein
MLAAISNGSVRGWADNGLSSFEIRTDGSVVASPFHFDLAQTAGPYSLARAQGRLWQSTDRGATWTEVDPPPRGGGKGDVEITACSPLGCDLHHWYRIGWAATPPAAREDAPVAPGAARIAPVPLPLLACKPTGAPKLDAQTRTNNSPEDLGLGNARLPIATDNSETQYTRTIFGHTMINPPHGEEGSSDRDEVASRMVVSGYQTDSGNGSHFTVLGPSKDPMNLRRPVGFVAPFDPSSLSRRTSYGIAELVAAARTVGMTSSDVLAEDPSMPTAIIPALALDPLLPSDLAFGSELGMVGVVRSAGRVKVTMRAAPQDSQWLVSAAWTGADDLALLAEVCGHAGLVEEGLAALGEALAVVDRTGERNYEAELHRLEGELRLRHEEPAEEAESCFRRALDIARRQGARSLELRAATSLARVLAGRGRRDDARTTLDDVYRRFTEGFDTVDLKDAEALLKELLR